MLDDETQNLLDAIKMKEDSLDWRADLYIELDHLKLFIEYMSFVLNKKGSGIKSHCCGDKEEMRNLGFAIQKALGLYRAWVGKEVYQIANKYYIPDNADAP